MKLIRQQLSYYLIGYLIGYATGYLTSSAEFIAFEH